jgi:hypothetical protein
MMFSIRLVTWVATCRFTVLTCGLGVVACVIWVMTSDFLPSAAK